MFRFPEEEQREQLEKLRQLQRPKQSDELNESAREFKLKLIPVSSDDSLTPSLTGSTIDSHPLTPKSDIG